MAYKISKGTRGSGDIVFEEDSDTGIDFEDNTIKLETGGSERLVVTNAGIGIGTDDPDNTLHVQSAGTTHIKIQSEAGYEAALRLKAGTGASTYVWTPGNTSDIRLYAGGADRVHVDNDGSVGIGTTSPTEKLDVNSDAIRIRTAQTPASATATGTAGMVCWDADYVYVCTATNTWRRAAISSW